MIAALLLALQASASPPPAQPDLGWLAGYWLSCENGRESPRRGATGAVA